MSLDSDIFFAIIILMEEKISPLGMSWDEFEEKNFTPEDRAAMDLRANLICKLIDARNNQHLTQRELAEKAGLTQAAIARIERGKTLPNLTTLFKILLPLGYSLDIVQLEGKIV